MINLAQQIINNKLTKVTLERFETIIRHRDNIKLLDGDIIECGVWKGGSLALMGKFLNDVGVKRKIFGFDTFDGK